MASYLSKREDKTKGYMPSNNLLVYAELYLRNSIYCLVCEVCLIVQNDPKWTCLGWVQNVLACLDADGIVATSKVVV